MRRICLRPTGPTNLPARPFNAVGPRRTSPRYQPQFAWTQMSLQPSGRRVPAGKAGSMMLCARPPDFNGVQKRSFLERPKLVQQKPERAQNDRCCIHSRMAATRKSRSWSKSKVRAARTGPRVRSSNRFRLKTSVRPLTLDIEHNCSLQRGYQVFRSKHLIG